MSATETDTELDSSTETSAGTTSRPGPTKPPRETKAPRLAGERPEAAAGAGTVAASDDPAALDLESKAAADGDTAPARERRRGVVRRSAPWVLVALATAAAVVFALLWRNADSALGDAQTLEHRRAAVVATGTEFLTALTNFSADTIDADVQRIRAFAVGDFAQQVDQFFGETNVAALKKAQVVSKGVVRSVYVQSVDGPQASVFGVVDEAVRNAHSAPRTETIRVDVEMLETSDGWRVASVSILEAPGGGPLG